MITIAWAQGKSSVIVKFILALWFLGTIFSSLNLAPPVSTIEGLPYLSFSTPISLKNTPLLNPVPRAFVTASLAANLFAYEDDFFNLPSDFLISISVILF